MKPVGKGAARAFAVGKLKGHDGSESANWIKHAGTYCELKEKEKKPEFSFAALSEAEKQKFIQGWLAKIDE